MKTFKVALFQRIVGSSYEYTTVMSFASTIKDEDADRFIPGGYVRLSPWLNIDFPSLDTETVIDSQMKQLDKAEQEIREQFQERLNTINDTRQRIRALAFKPSDQNTEQSK